MCRMDKLLERTRQVLEPMEFEANLGNTAGTYLMPTKGHKSVHQKQHKFLDTQASLTDSRMNGSGQHWPQQPSVLYRCLKSWLACLLINSELTSLPEGTRRPSSCGSCCPQTEELWEFLALGSILQNTSPPHTNIQAMLRTLT